MTSDAWCKQVSECLQNQGDLLNTLSNLIVSKGVATNDEIVEMCVQLRELREQQENKLTFESWKGFMSKARDRDDQPCPQI